MHCVSTNERIFYDAFSLSTKREIQKSTYIHTLSSLLLKKLFHRALPPPPLPGRRFQTPTTRRRCRVSRIVSRSCEVTRRAVATSRLFFLLMRGSTAAMTRQIYTFTGTSQYIYCYAKINQKLTTGTSVLY